MILDKDWQDWIVENLSLQCSATSLVDLMVQNGFDRQFSINAIHNSMNTGIETNCFARGVCSIPEINYLRIADSNIKVSMRISKPDIVIIDNFLSDYECDAIMSESLSRLAPSEVVSVHSLENQLHLHRSSHGMYFSRCETPLIESIESRINLLTNYPIDHGEGIQVLHYKIGAEYRPHFDYFDENTLGGQKHMMQGGQRVATLVMYLNNVEQGGETIFPELGLKVFPKKGAILFFSNINNQGQVEPLTLHGGAPVFKGEKWIATKWLRQYKY